MRITERQQQILDMLETDVFCTVQQLASSTFTSPSSIRRDLSALQNRGLVCRTHGGVSLATAREKAPALRSRMNQNVTEKRKIARKAASLLHDNMSVMLDGSSTASFLLPHLAEHSGITLFTNSMTTAVHAIELGITTHCIGGKAVRSSAILAGEAACEAVRGLYVDILFFSSQCLDEHGVISDSTFEENELRKQMLRSARRTVFLCDSSKFEKRALYALTDLDAVDDAFFSPAQPSCYAHVSRPESD